MKKTLTSRIRTTITRDFISGLLLLSATATALIWANSAVSDSYFRLRDVAFGIPDFTIMGFTMHGVTLSLGQWASDGLLTLFFFVAGLELKQECVTGDLRKPSKAMVPVSAAFGGVAVPALLYFLITTALRPEVSHGWAIPTATDIAFAVSALALAGSFLPSALRTFLLTLAIVDDLIAIIIIAVFYSGSLRPGYLAAAALVLVVFAVVTRRGISAWFVLLPLAALTWYFVHEAGIHATIAGVLLSFMIPVTPSAENAAKPEEPQTASKAFRPKRHHSNDVAKSAKATIEPLSIAVAVPLFALFSAGVPFHGWKGITSAFNDALSLGIVAALFFGKASGVLAATFIATKFTPAQLHDSIRWPDMTGLSFLTGIGFTVSLLLSELSFGTNNADDDYAKIGILCGSLLSALIGLLILSARNRHYRQCQRRAPK